MGQRADGFIQDNAAVVENFLELGCGLLSLMCGNIGFTSHINGVQIGPVVIVKRRQPQFIRSSDPKSIKRLLRVCTKERKLSAKCRQVIELYDRILRKP